MPRVGARPSGRLWPVYAMTEHREASYRHKPASTICSTTPTPVTRSRKPLARAREAKVLRHKGRHRLAAGDRHHPAHRRIVRYQITDPRSVPRYLAGDPPCSLGCAARGVISLVQRRACADLGEIRPGHCDPLCDVAMESAHSRCPQRRHRYRQGDGTLECVGCAPSDDQSRRAPRESITRVLSYREGMSAVSGRKSEWRAR